MRREELDGLAAFVAVAESASFTKAAAVLGMSPSALSHAMRALETRLGVRLLARTTRSVATTEAGERLLCTLRPAFADIATELQALGSLRDTVAGTVRLTTFKHAAVTVIMPVLPAFLEANPAVTIELNVDDELTDIVAARYDAGIRFGEKVDKDMIAVRVGADIRSVVVGSPTYLARWGTPRVPQDLAAHRCINYRFASSGRLYQWEFEKAGRALQVHVEGSLVFNDSDLVVTAALAGHGLAYLFEEFVESHVASGRLRRVLDDWSTTSPGYYLYHPSRRQTPPALAALIEAVRSQRRGRSATSRSQRISNASRTDDPEDA